MTGQYPRRRETDAEAKERVEGLEERRRRPVRVPRSVWLSRLPHITASGRLVAP